MVSELSEVGLGDSGNDLKCCLASAGVAMGNGEQTEDQATQYLIAQ